MSRREDMDAILKWSRSASIAADLRTKMALGPAAHCCLYDSASFRSLANVLTNASPALSVLAAAGAANKRSILAASQPLGGLIKLITAPAGLSAVSIAAMKEGLGGSERVVAALASRQLASSSGIAAALSSGSHLGLASWVGVNRSVGAIPALAMATSQSLATALATGQVLNAPRLSMLAVRPTMVLDDLTTETLLEAEEGDDEVTVQRGHAAIGGAALTVSLSTDVAVAALNSLPVAAPSVEQEADLPPCNLPRLVAAEVLTMLDDAPDLLYQEDLYELAHMPHIAATATGIAHRLLNCNRVWPEEEKLFSYTDRFVESCLCFTQYWDPTQTGFCQIIRWLYFMLYEAAGADNLRFLRDGLMDTGEAEVIFDIKQFRNLHCDHDLEHGSPKDVREKKRKLTALCLRYINKPLPSSHVDYGSILLQIYQRVQAFTDTLYRRLAEQRGSETKT